MLCALMMDEGENRVKDSYRDNYEKTCGREDQIRSD
jgi:hypothetical protein